MKRERNGSGSSDSSGEVAAAMDRESASAVAAAGERDVDGSNDGSREQGVELGRVRAGEDVEERATARRGCA